MPARRTGRAPGARRSPAQPHSHLCAVDRRAASGSTAHRPRAGCALIDQPRSVSCLQKRLVPRGPQTPNPARMFSSHWLTSGRMLDPRIYRTGLIAVAVALIVLAFSLTDQQGPLGTTLPPEAFNGQNAYTDMVGLARKYPARAPGSRTDRALAAKVALALAKDGFNVSTRSAIARTAA